MMERIDKQTSTHESRQMSHYRASLLNQKISIIIKVQSPMNSLNLDKMYILCNIDESVGVNVT